MHVCLFVLYVYASGVILHTPEVVVFACSACAFSVVSRVRTIPILGIGGQYLPVLGSIGIGQYLAVLIIPINQG